MYPFPLYQQRIVFKNYAIDSSFTEDDFIEIERCDVDGTDSDDVSDPDTADYWYADSFDVDVLNQSGRDLYVIPEMEERIDPLPTNSIVGCKNDTSPPSTQDHFDVKVFQLMALMMLPGELAKHAVSEGTKAVTKYTSA